MFGAQQGGEQGGIGRSGQSRGLLLGRAHQDQRGLEHADAQQRSLDAQLQKMLGLQAQAQALISQPKINREDALRALEASVKQRLGASAQINIVGDRATVTLRNTPAEALAQWLTQARVNARAIPADVRLTRNLSAAGSPAAWDGTLALAIPSQ